ncbi:hypothetical protein ABN584_02110 [Gloeocapsa sp. BRSZ]
MREVGCVRRCPPLSKPTVGFTPVEATGVGRGEMICRFYLVKEN